MPFLGTTQIGNEPILINRFEGHLTVDDVQAASQAVDEMVSDLGFREAVYVVVDVATATSSFVEAISIIRDQGQQKPGSVSDPRLSYLFYGAPPMVKFFLSTISKAQFGGVNIPVFARMEDALETARLMRTLARKTA